MNAVNPVGNPIKCDVGGGSDAENMPLKSQVSPGNQDIYQLIQMQQNTINRLTQELTKKSASVPIELYEKALDDLETEKYDHAKTKIMLSDAQFEIDSLKSQLEYFKNELEKEHCAYSKALQFLKDKCLNESDKAFDLLSKMGEAEMKYKETKVELNERENKYSEACNKARQKERDYEKKMEELNLKSEQEKYVNNLLNEKSKGKRK